MQALFDYLGNVIAWLVYLCIFIVLSGIALSAYDSYPVTTTAVGIIIGICFLTACLEKAWKRFKK